MGSKRKKRRNLKKKKRVESEEECMQAFKKMKLWDGEKEEAQAGRKKP